MIGLEVRVQALPNVSGRGYCSLQVMSVMKHINCMYVSILIKQKHDIS